MATTDNEKSAKAGMTLRPNSENGPINRRLQKTSSLLTDLEKEDKRRDQDRPDSPSTTDIDHDVEARGVPLGQASTRASTITKKRGYIFMIFIVLTQLVQLFPYGAGVNGALTIGRAIGASDVQAAWIAASYPLTQGAFVLISGRLGSVYGHKFMLTLGGTWWVFWTLATAYGKNIIGISFMRALAGIGGGLMQPNSVALLGITFPPGKQRNIAFALFGAMAPVGAAGGGVIAGIFMQWTDWPWLFFFLGLLGLVVYGAAILAVPEDVPLDPNGKVDWIGAYLGVAGLILFNFVWNQAPAAGWDQPYIYVLLIVSVLHFAAFLLWEAKFASSPIMPLDIWKAPSFGPLMLTLVFAFMSVGIYVWYVAVFLQNIRGWDVVLEGCAFIPLAICGSGAAFIAAWLVPRMSAQVIIALGCIASATINILLATTPRHQTYWAMIFPAMIVTAFTIDLMFAASQIITSATVSKKHQGPAGSLISTLLTYCLSIGLGFAGTVEKYTNRGGTDLIRGYRSAAYFGIALAGTALIIDVLFVRMKKNTVEGWQGEDAENES
ncbi:MFS general substrate transporter [Rhizodiscina lignyota]|uniref:MFS general substrate transporter n=1 Tax=Rhizodiscina lignyota TaxID=1504668 RepID=A0A9P4M9K4_9PEZI|nr:MFS general substrate transporter [Rhizodiscina lignyota]